MTLKIVLSKSVKCDENLFDACIINSLFAIEIRKKLFGLVPTTSLDLTAGYGICGKIQCPYRKNT